MLIPSKINPRNIAIFALIAIIGNAAESAPRISGNVAVINNEANTVIVVSGSIGLNLGFKFFGLNGLGISASTGESHVNVNSISMKGDSQIGGNATIANNQLKTLIALGAKVNINSVAMGE